MMDKEAPMKRTLQYIGMLAATLAIAAISSFSDVNTCDRDEYPCDCDEYVQITGWDETEEPVVIYARPSQLVMNMPTDNVLMHFGMCLEKLILNQRRATSQEAVIVLTDLIGRVKVIDSLMAAAMADPDIADAEYDMEELAHAASMAYYWERGDD
jgi:hypothetical protein